MGGRGRAWREHSLSPSHRQRPSFPSLQLHTPLCAKLWPSSEQVGPSRALASGLGLWSRGGRGCRGWGRVQAVRVCGG